MFSPDRTLLYVDDAPEERVAVVDTSTVQVVGHIPGSSAQLAIAPDGRRLYTDTGDSTIAVLDPAARTVETTITLPEAGSWGGIAVSPDGRRIFTGQGVDVDAPGSGNAVRIMDAASGAVVADLPIPGAPHLLVAVPGGDRLLVARRGGGALLDVDISAYR